MDVASAAHMRGMNYQLITLWLTAAAAFTTLIAHGARLITWSNSRRKQRHRSAAKAAAREEARQVPKPQVAVSVHVAAETARRTRSD